MPEMIWLAFHAVFFDVCYFRYLDRDQPRRDDLYLVGYVFTQRINNLE